MTTEPAGTIRRYLAQRAPAIFRATFGAKMLGAFGIVFDGALQRLLDAVRAPINTDDILPAYDALQLLGQEQSMPQYPNESWVDYRERLIDPWSTWAKAGDETTIVDQLARAGATPGGEAQIFRYTVDSPSEFFVFFPYGTHPITSQGPIVGSFTVGDGSIVGPEGAPAGWLASWVALVKHWRPVFWRCRWLVFELSGWTVGTGHTVGEPGLVIGGSQAVTGVE